MFPKNRYVASKKINVATRNFVKCTKASKEKAFSALDHDSRTSILHPTDPCQTPGFRIVRFLPGYLLAFCFCIPLRPTCWATLNHMERLRIPTSSPLVCTRSKKKQCPYMCQGPGFRAPPPTPMVWSPPRGTTVSGEIRSFLSRRWLNVSVSEW